MARAQAQYLRIFTTASQTIERWQSYYVNMSVGWESQNWRYVPFIADGFTAGITVDDGDISITAPATRQTVATFETGIRDGHLVEVLIYEFDPTIENDQPQAEQELIGRYLGQITGGNATLTSITVQLGSALAPVGAQIPPRKFTTELMGKGCRL